MNWLRRTARILEDGEELSRWTDEELERVLKRYREMTALELTAILSELKLPEIIRR